MKFRNLFLLTAVALIFCGSARAQDSLNMVQLGHLAYSGDLSDVRGAYFNGHEYALVGAANGLSIVDVTDPTAPTEVFFAQGPNSIWRDPFFYNGHAYCVTEGGGGLLIVDMSPLPGSTNLATTLYTGSTHSMQSAHNIYIDADNAKAYVFGGNQIGGAVILDLTDPMSPVELGIWNDYYIHDGFVRGDTLWAACLENGLSIVDVHDPTSPTVLVNWDTPSEFTHNVWPSDNSHYCYTTDEVSSGFVAAYNTTDLQNVQLTDRVHWPLSELVIPHNVHFKDDYLVVSHYRDGVVVYDASDPDNIILTGYYDTSPFSGNGFNGSWGTWPYLPSGNLLVSDIEEGLFVIGNTYKRAARLQGNVTDAGNASPLNNVQITIVGTAVQTTTDLFGDYASGLEAAVTYEVTFQKGGYLTQTVSNVVLQTGQTVTLDVQLVPAVPSLLTGLVTEAGSGNPITGATVAIDNEFFNLSLTTDATGRYTDSTFYSGQYTFTVGAWGFVGECQDITFNGSSAAPDFDLATGYDDDFSLDLGWTVTGDAATGIWVRDVPIGTEYNGTPANPGSDADGDCGGLAYVTGNAEGAVNIDDVDDGMTVLTSPSMDLAGMPHAALSFKYWFFNQGGGSTPNDDMVISIDDGSSVTELASLPTTNDVWTSYSVLIDDQVALTSDMRLRVAVQDAPPGHLVEAGLDRFRIDDATGVLEAVANTQISVYPNPLTDGWLNVDVQGPIKKNASVRLFDLTGKAVSSKKVLTTGRNRISVSLVAGAYMVVTDVDGKKLTQKFMMIR